MTARTPDDESMVAAMCAALSPYPWRRFTPELLSRLTLAARDRHLLEEVLASVPGAAVGRWEVLEPVGRDDPRAGAIVEFLGRHRWTETGLSTLCERLAGVVSPELGQGGTRAY